MALFRSNVSYGTSPEVVELLGYAYFTNTGAPAANTVVSQVRTTVPQAATGQQLAQQYTVGPDARVVVVMNPTTAYHPAVASGGSTSIVMLDLRAFPADIVMVQGSFVPAPSGTTGALPSSGNVGNFQVLAIDNATKFVYFACTTAAGGSAVPGNGASLQFDVAFSDTYSV